MKILQVGKRILFIDGPVEVCNALMSSIVSAIMQ